MIVAAKALGMGDDTLPHWPEEPNDPSAEKYHQNLADDKTQANFQTASMSKGDSSDRGFRSFECV